MDLGIGGRVALITGASAGIGAATARRLASEGVRLVLAARQRGPLDALVAEIEAVGGTATAVAVDVTDRRSSAVLRAAALERHGRVDIIVNNAGGGGSSIQRFDEQEWLDVYTANVTSALRLVHECLPDLRAQRWGRIVNVASTSARHCDPRFGAYGAAKAALLHVSRNLALAYSAEGVLTNCVLPGLTRTEGVLRGYEDAAAASGRTPEEIEQRMVERQPIAMGRTGEPDEVAAVIVFLCSELASWVTGSLVSVDGGTLTDVP
jgi:NAD(P)-dependent dehydrogenase (short-subunit alcohol dehydrogenase family)